MELFEHLDTSSLDTYLGTVVELLVTVQLQVTIFLDVFLVIVATLIPYFSGRLYYPWKIAQIKKRCTLQKMFVDRDELIYSYSITKAVSDMGKNV